jgi:tagatose-1,6-bisphosphate aldolase non-catalytic subunit AgaZ/GatZ
MAQKLYSVLTGDIIGSSQLSSSEQKKIGEVFRKITLELKEFFPDAVKYDLDHYRGDGWQLLIHQPEQSLKIAIFIRALLKSGYLQLKLDSKISIAIGEVDAISEERISQSRGAAFTNSGRELEKLKERNFCFYYNDETANEYVNLLFGFIDRIVAYWSDKQAYAVLGVLRGLSQNKIAAWLPEKIKQPSVTERLQGASLGLLEESFLFYDKLVNRITS